MLLFWLSLLALPSRASSLPLAYERIDAIVSLFENSTPEPQYCYVEALDDGRGYTAGKGGFTTASGDLLEVIEKFVASNPDTSQAWQKLLPTLKERAEKEDGSLEGLEEMPALWQTSCTQESFRLAQDSVIDEAYRQPAQAAAQTIGLHSQLGFLVFYDSLIQHGDGNTEDSFRALLRRTGAHPADESEADYLERFLTVRRADLWNPADKETRKAWRASVSRVSALRGLVRGKHWDLEPPYRLKVYGDCWQFTQNSIHKCPGSFFSF